MLRNRLYESLPEDLFQRSLCLLKLIKACTRTVSLTYPGDATTLNMFSRRSHTVAARHGSLKVCICGALVLLRNYWIRARRELQRLKSWGGISDQRIIYFGSSFGQLSHPIVVVAMPSNATCSNCGVYAPGWYCQACKAASVRVPRYCSQQCQREDWSNHKVVCKSKVGKWSWRNTTAGCLLASFLSALLAMMSRNWRDSICRT